MENIPPGFRNLISAAREYPHVTERTFNMDGYKALLGIGHREALRYLKIIPGPYYDENMEISPLMCAVRNEHIEGVSYLLSIGTTVCIDVHAANENEMAEAFRLGCPTIVAMLIEKERGFYKYHKNLLIRLATSRRNAALLKYLMEEGDIPEHWIGPALRRLLA